MPIAREAWPYALGVSCIAGLAAIFGWLGTAVFFLGLAAFVLFFFRDPERVVPSAPGLIVSPADGKVIKIDDAPGRDGLTRVCVFLSIFNVHINRSPIAGRIERVEYRPGVFLAAFDPRASTENEQNVVTVRGSAHAVVFSQIAGLIARRIVFRKKPEDLVARGERVGLIKFGSRVDVFLPKGVALKVSVGDRVRGGESVLAELQ